MKLDQSFNYDQSNKTTRLIMRGKYRFPFFVFRDRVQELSFTIPNLLHYGSPLSIENAIELLSESGHGADDPVEGAVWRVERKGEIDFITKYVRHDKQDGKYFPEINNGVTTWNMDVSGYKCLCNNTVQP